ncbi:uncharacterized protein B0H18DRAFT_1121295 [Fomitopsis serialis]|uniref:uncharacterized protein n=1 Tax=Fomitopsis serialis TaxID=139415 RepID=UPI0020085DAF|nr:uncharacterized protein B0H18DRAFT_1121295 [Neoantrodia serialis]KAH9921600.1 hypothetical protein B0H18DRAFT_1121295 [Neoantrodia serialis]
MALARTPFHTYAAPPDTPDFGLYTSPYVPTVPRGLLEERSEADELFGMSEEDELDHLTEVLNDRQHRLLRENGERRYKEWQACTAADVEADVMEEIKTRIRGWEEVAGRTDSDVKPTTTSSRSSVRVSAVTLAKVNDAWVQV